MHESWSPMLAADLPSVAAVSDAVHGAYTERVAVYAERLALYPAGCFVMRQAGEVTGYLICHPWWRDTPPPLDMLLGAIPDRADTFYLHDLALLPACRGTGAGAAATPLVLALAEAAGFREVTLMAVNGADRFWAKQGFARVPSAHADSYGHEACLMRRAI